MTGSRATFAAFEPLMSALQKASSAGVQNKSALPSTADIPYPHIMRLGRVVELIRFRASLSEMTGIVPVSYHMYYGVQRTLFGQLLSPPPSPCMPRRLTHARH